MIGVIDRGVRQGYGKDIYKGYSDTVDYSVGILENGDEIEILNVDGYRLYQPNANTEWVFVFYLGTARLRKLTGCSTAKNTF